MAAPTTQAVETVQCDAIVDEHMAGQRCDQIAARLFPQYSRARLQSWIKSGELTVDDRATKVREKLFAGAKLSISATLVVEANWVAEPGPLDIVFEDDDVLVVNKPDNLVVHPAAGNHRGTLVNYVLAHAADNCHLPRGGIVHRLDKDTTGLMVIARSLHAHSELVKQLEAREVSRHYRAIATGNIISGGSVELPIGRHPTARTKMAVIPAQQSGGKHAVTHYRIAKKFARHTELNIKLETGRTHQIRVHMAHINHPLVGDRLYNSRQRPLSSLDAETNRLLSEFPRQALHACELAFEHPASGELMQFQCDPPEDYMLLLDQLS